jgi:polyisoprenoid-binding protein YceI
MRRRRIVTLALGALVGVFIAAPTAQAQRRAFIFDLAHSQINFVAEAMLLSAHGSFEKFDGDIQIDRQNLENSTVTITIEAASINTRVEMRDNDLRSPRFFDAANNPKITFVATKITKVDDKNLSIAGDLTIRGVTKPVVVPAQIAFFREGDGRFKGTFHINRKDFGVSYNSAMNPIEDMVEVQFDFHLNDKQMMEERRQRMQQRQQPPAKPPLS